jgi:hypothetical protein
MTKANKVIEKPQIIAHFDGLIEIVDDGSGRPIFLIKEDDELLMEPEWEIEGVRVRPPTKDDLPFILPMGEEVIEFYGKEDPGLYQDLKNYFPRFCYLPDELWVVPATWGLSTYQQDNECMHYSPILQVYALPGRGKTRLGKAITSVGFRGVVMNQIREALLFRLSHNLRSTVFLDVMDFWGEAKRNNCSDIILGRFEKGHKVGRVIKPEAGAFHDTTYYEVHGPTLIATNRPVHDILDTRCLPITMPNAPRNTYEDPTPIKGREMKARLTAWRARTYQVQFPEVEPMAEIEGRLWDVCKPLLQILTAVCPDDLEDLHRYIEKVDRAKRDDMRTSPEGMIIEAINRLKPKGRYVSCRIPLKDILAEVNEGRRDEYALTAPGLGQRLKAMEFTTKHTNGRSHLILSQPKLDKLLKEYGICDSDEEDDEG